MGAIISVAGGGAAAGVITPTVGTGVYKPAGGLFAAGGTAGAGNPAVFIGAGAAGAGRSASP